MNDEIFIATLTPGRWKLTDTLKGNYSVVNYYSDTVSLAKIEGRNGNLYYHNVELSKKVSCEFAKYIESEKAARDNKELSHLEYLLTPITKETT